MYVENAASVDVTSTVFMSNSAESGGGLICRNCESCYFFNCSFRDNEAIEFGGGSLQFTDSSTLIIMCLFVGNLATTDGGAIRAVGMTNLTILDSVFESNHVASGSGAAVWLSACPNVSIARNHYERNEALAGGGTIFWEVHSGMPEP